MTLPELRARARGPFPAVAGAALLLLLGPAATCLAGCGQAFDGEFRLEPVTAERPADPALPLAVAGRWLVYMASEAQEAGGTDLNGDGDDVDSVAVAVDVIRREETVLGVAAVEAAAVGDEIFLVVDEAAELGPGGSLGPDDPPFSLAHWTRGDVAPARFDVLSELPGPRLFADQERLYYASAETPAGPNETTLRFVEEDAPTAPVVVRSGGGEGRLSAVPIELRDGLLHARLRESTPAFAAGDWPDKDLNGDGDQGDEALGLLDATDPSARLFSTRLALSDAAAPAARLLPDADWLVAFLVDEVGEGADLDDPALFDAAWAPEACPGLAADGVQADDAVLHHVRFRDLEAGEPPVNTGLAGAGRVVALSEVVATLSPETAAGCDLNADGDDADTIARWTEAVAAGDPVLPPGAIDELHAVDPTAGPSMGLSSVGERLVVVVDEAADGRDFDGDPEDHSLVASRDPLDPLETGFVFEHRSGVAEFDESAGEFVTVQPYVGASWMAERQSGGRLAVACEERVAGRTLNINDFCDEVQKDADLADEVPTWPRVRSSAERDDVEPDFPLTFPGVGYALAADPGLVLSGGHAFLRVDEQADLLDHNGDGDRDDVVVFASQLASCTLTLLGDSTDAGGPVATSDGLVGAAFLSDEAQAGADLDGDGDAQDVVVVYLRF